MVEKVNLDALAWESIQSPRGQFQRHEKYLSRALGCPKDAGPEHGGHPFDVTLVRIPPAATAFPKHQHSAQWEFYIILEGMGVVNHDEGLTAIKAGDVFLQKPGQAHQLINTGAIDLVYYVIADNPPSDIIYYPDSQKWKVKPNGETFKMQPVDYYLDEE